MKTLDEFIESVDLYSADLSRWPESDMKSAISFMKQDRAAKAYFDAALALDEQLRGYQPRQADLHALESRILKEIAATARPRAVAPAASLSIRKAWIFAPGGGLLAAAILGFIIGLLPPRHSADTLVDPVYYTQDQILGGDADVDTGGMY